METVEVVIKIPEEWIEQFKAFEHPSALQVCVLQGTVLTKGHGRLIDADEVSKGKFHFECECDCAVCSHSRNCECDLINSIPTVIEADKGVSE